MAALLDKQALRNSSYSKYTGLMDADGRKGYCTFNYMIEESSKKIQLVNYQSACPADWTAFVAVHCFGTSIASNVSSADGHPNNLESVHCLNAKDIVKLNKCDDGWLTSITNGSHCVCSKLSGLIWVEITYARPYSVECMQLTISSVSDLSTADL